MLESLQEVLIPKSSQTSRPQPTGTRWLQCSTKVKRNFPTKYHLLPNPRLQTLSDIFISYNRLCSRLTLTSTRSRSCRTWGDRLLSLGIGGCRRTPLRDSPVGTQAQSHPARACWHSFWPSLQKWCFLWERRETSHGQIQENRICIKHWNCTLSFRNCLLVVHLRKHT